MFMCVNCVLEHRKETRKGLIIKLVHCFVECGVLKQWYLPINIDDE